MPSRIFLIKLIVLSIVMIMPLWVMLIWAWPVESDFIIYATLLKTFSNQLWSGDWYPRWLIELNAGLGGPHFYIYGPLPYYITSFLHWFSRIDPYGFGRITASMMIAICVAGITYYRWVSLQLPKEIAENSALLYAGFPYLLTIIYYSFGYQQLWGIALFPFLLESSHEMSRKGWRSIPKLGCAYALLCLSHLPSTVVFSFIPIIYVLVFSSKKHCIFYTFLALCAALLGACLAAVYLLPLLENRSYIKTESFITVRFFYTNNFLDMFSYMGFILVVIPLCALYYLLPKLNKNRFFNLSVRFWLIVIVLLSFLILPISKPVWALLPPIQYLQFPSRLFVGMLPGAVYIATVWLQNIGSKILLKILFVVTLVTASLVSYSNLFYINVTPSVKPVLSYSLTPFDKGYMQTRWTKDEDNEGRDYMYALPALYNAHQPAELEEGKGSVSMFFQSPRIIKVHADISSANAKVVLRHFYFPGWYSNYEIIQIKPNSEGFLSFDLPRGKYDIAFHARWKGEREGLLLSLFGLMITVLIAAASRIKRVVISPTH